jgi:hypothetical protein
LILSIAHAPVDDPEFGFFEACGLDPTHTTYKIIGRLGE